MRPGGFSLGPRDFDERLRNRPAHELAKSDLTRIDFINQLFGQSYPASTGSAVA